MPTTIQSILRRLRRIRAAMRRFDDTKLADTLPTDRAAIAVAGLFIDQVRYQSALLDIRKHRKLSVKHAKQTANE